MKDISKIIMAFLGAAFFTFLLVLDAGKISYAGSPSQIRATGERDRDIVRDGWVKGEAVRCYDVSNRLSLVEDRSGRRSGAFDFLYKKKLKSYYALLEDGTTVPVRATAKWYSARFTEDGVPKEGTTVVISGFAEKIHSQLRGKWQSNAESAFENEAGSAYEVSVDGRTIELTFIVQSYVNVHAYSLLWQRIIASALVVLFFIIYAVLQIVGIRRGWKNGAGGGILGKVLGLVWVVPMIWYLVLWRLV